ncbi:hypothetical protein [Polynucleobacter sp. JS-JIR-II-b4]|uniref:hypothetical protein n=1 Tax=Polynucleobacter sp. JS-JIR-II-b4 TaxID=1758390 RepID=UPI001BFD102F|nr:hypothetical protein [Polynucleobacter sp. JS-JIR-II-b4]QWE02058.1 hypothetical protein ICV90_07690 [Polynucleobacter sp. JS-JIR-II-b4]
MGSILLWRPESWSHYLLIYIVPGVLMAAYFLINAWKERPGEFAKGLMKAVGKEVSFVDQLKEFLVYCFATACVLLGWPGFVIYYLIHKKDEAANQAWQKLPDFYCSPKYLISQVNPIDVEIASYVIDPLSAVPALPFGHLNHGWLRFLADATDGDDEVWSFYIPKGSRTGKYQSQCSSDIRGYAKVRNKKILSEFIIERD